MKNCRVGAIGAGQRRQGVGFAGQRAIAGAGDDVQGGQQRVLRSADGEFLVLQLNPALRKFRTRGERLPDQFLDRRDRLHLGNPYLVGGDDPRRGNRRAGHAGLTQRGLKNRLLLQQARVGHRERLFTGGNFGLGAHHFNGRQRADLHLPPVVLQQLLRGGQRVLGHLNRLVEGNQVPVQVHHRGDRGLHLQLEGEVAHLAIVFGDTDLPAVNRRAETLQQVLRNREVERGEWWKD